MRPFFAIVSLKDTGGRELPRLLNRYSDMVEAKFYCTSKRRSGCNGYTYINDHVLDCMSTVILSGRGENRVALTRQEFREGDYAMVSLHDLDALKKESRFCGRRLYVVVLGPNMKVYRGILSSRGFSPSQISRRCDSVNEYFAKAYEEADFILYDFDAYQDYDRLYSYFVAKRPVQD